MGINTNTWNKIRYTIYTPIYDRIANVFKASRKKSINSLSIKKGERVLIIGAGTGLDLEFIPSGCEVVATDITQSMIDKLKAKNENPEFNLHAMVMDGQNLEFESEGFDKVILHLILAVIPDPVACAKEVDRVLKPNGEVAVFDKFIAKHAQVSVLRRGLNTITNFLFSDVTRDIYTIVKDTELRIISDSSADFNGNFRIVKLGKE